jgi:hypothetical protein
MTSLLRMLGTNRMGRGQGPRGISMSILTAIVFGTQLAQRPKIPFPPGGGRTGCRGEGDVVGRANEIGAE